MNRILISIPILTVLGITIVLASLYVDWGDESYEWFQRSGSLIVLIGAILGYRSVFRLGVKGVGRGADRVVRRSKVKRSYTDENGRRMMTVEDSPEDVDYDYQVFMDKSAGYVGAVFAIFGTFIWGYGDLLGKL